MKWLIRSLFLLFIAYDIELLTKQVKRVADAIEAEQAERVATRIELQRIANAQDRLVSLSSVTAKKKVKAEVTDRSTEGIVFPEALGR